MGVCSFIPYLSISVPKVLVVGSISKVDAGMVDDMVVFRDNKTLDLVNRSTGKFVGCP